jgi:hypothetical protein
LFGEFFLLLRGKIKILCQFWLSQNSRIWVQIVYLGSDPGSILKGEETKEKRPIN